MEIADVTTFVSISFLFYGMPLPYTHYSGLAEKVHSYTCIRNATADNFKYIFMYIDVNIFMIFGK